MESKYNESHFDFCGTRIEVNLAKQIFFDFGALMNISGSFDLQIYCSGMNVVDKKFEFMLASLSKLI